MSKLLIYRASAGSGKTYALVASYIKWALRYPSACKHILAVTFTNRAAYEMKQRILACLYSLSIGQATPLLDELCNMGWTFAEVQQRSKEALSNIVYHYSDFAVTTIDSFFYKIIQTFAKEMGLNPDFSIAMDEKLVSKEIVAGLFATCDPLLQKWMVDFALSKLLTGKTWNIKNDIEYLGNALFEETFKLYEKELFIAFEQPDAIPSFISAIQEYIGIFEQKMQAIGQAAIAILNHENIEPAHFTYGKKGVVGYFFKLANRKDFAPTKRVMMGMDHVDAWLNIKTNHQATRLIGVVTTLLQPLLIEAVTLYNQEKLGYTTALAVAQSMYSFGIIGKLLMALAAYRSQHNVLLISDISALLYHLIQENDTPFFYERIGNQFQHFLIDEFQDLSFFQWTNIKPLLHNSLAQGYANLLVGDVKQSIYRWRGSSWKLLNHLVEEAFKENQIYILNTNWRSQSTVVQFNNHVFSHAANQLIHFLQSELMEANDAPSIALLKRELAQMQRAYGDVTQQIAISDMSKDRGYVECVFFRTSTETDKENAKSWQALAKQALIQRIWQLEQEGILAKDMVILVRNNNEVNVVTNLLRMHSQDQYGIGPYTTRADPAPVLWSHVAIRFLIHTLYYLDNEHDLINKAAWVQAYHSCMEQSSIHWHHFTFQHHDSAKHIIDDLIPQAFWMQKGYLTSLPIYACVALLVEIFFYQCHRHRYIINFLQDMLLDYTTKVSDSRQSFLIWWEKKGKNSKLPACSNANAIQVMTIHQSKGLEFPIVMIPFCNWNLDHMPQNAPLLWLPNHLLESLSPFNRFPIFPFRYGLALKHSYYAQDYYLERMQIHLDNLNLLYVAFTRAKERLYVMAPFPAAGIESPLTTTAELVYQCLMAQHVRTDQNSTNSHRLVSTVRETDLETRFCFGDLSIT